MAELQKPRHTPLKDHWAGWQHGTCNIMKEEKARKQGTHEKRRNLPPGLIGPVWGPVAKSPELSGS